MAVVKNLTVDQYSTYERTVILLDSNKSPFDLTGYIANSQIRKSHNQEVAATFVCNIQDAANGTITITLPYSATANISPGKYMYDILIYSSSLGVKTRAVEGTLEITPNITK